MKNTDEYSEFKTDRVIDLFFRALKGEALSAQRLSEEYNVSTRSITRDINALKNFLADHRDALGNAELVYSGSSHCYTLDMDSLLSNKELLSITKVLIGCRAFSRDELVTIISKLKQHTSASDREILENLVSKEIYHYNEIHYDCKSVIESIWKLTGHIEEKRIITIDYYRMDRKQVQHKICPASIMFTEFYFYLIAYKVDDNGDCSAEPTYFRIDRIINIIAHRENYTASPEVEFDEGILRKRSLYMFPGKLRKIRFEFSGPSVQAVLDKLPTAKVTDRQGGRYIIDAETYGEGIKMFLLSQGSWVKVLSPEDFVQEIQTEIEKMNGLYKN